MRSQFPCRVVFLLVLGGMRMIGSLDYLVTVLSIEHFETKIFELHHHVWIMKLKLQHAAF